MRWTYPVVWREPEIGDLRFLVMVSTASEPDALGFHDWIPVDAVSWERFGELQRRRSQISAPVVTSESRSDFPGMARGDTTG